MTPLNGLTRNGLQEKGFVFTWLVILIGLTVINYGHTAIDESLAKWVLVAFISAVVVLYGIVVLFNKRSAVIVSLSDLLAFGTVLYVLIHCWFWGSDKVGVSLLIATSYIYALFLKSSFQKTDTFCKVLLVLAGAGFFEAILGIYQVIFVLKGFTISHPQGTFNSPAIYGSFLAIACIAVLYLPYSPYGAGWRPRVKYVVVGFFLTIIVTGLFLSASRAAVLSLIISVLFFFRGKWMFFLQSLSKTGRISLMILLAVIFTVSCWALMELNPASLRGRLLIWKITCQIIAENPFTGVGVGNLHYEYAKMQAHYFSSPQPEHEQLLADLVAETYSEPLRVLVSFGSVGLTLVIATLLVAFKSKKDLSSPWAWSHIDDMVTAELYFIGCFCLFSFPFSNMVIALLAIFFVSIKIKGQKRFFSFSLRKPIIFLIIAIGMVAGIVSAERAYWISRWRHATIVSASLPPQPRKIPDFSYYYSHLHWNGFFLYKYGIELYNRGEYKHAVEVLAAAAKRQPNADVFLYIGSCLEQLKEYEMAESTYLLAAHMLPHHLMPKYRLLTLYEDTGQVQKARSMARAIIGMKVKISSMVTRQIRDYASSCLYKKSNI